MFTWLSFPSHFRLRTNRRNQQHLNRGFEVRLAGHHRGKSHGVVHELHDQPAVIQSSCWAGFPPELLRDVIKRLEESESTWPGRKHIVACAAVCRSWRQMCLEIVQSSELCGKLTFPVSLKQAYKCYMEALHIRPTFAIAWSNLAGIYLEVDDLNRALHYYKEAVKLKPYFSDACFNLGNVYKTLRMPQEYIVCLSTSLEVTTRQCSGFWFLFIKNHLLVLVELQQ